MTAPKNSKRNRWEQFHAFVQEEDLPVLRRDLEESGIDVDRVDLAVSAITAMGRNRAADGWLSRARKAQADFDRAVRAKRRWISEEFGNAREMVAAIASGSLGPRVQKQAFVFFRNGDLTTASDSDLRSFIDDCELLGLIEEKAGE